MNNLDRTTSVFFGWCSIGPSSALKWWKWCSGSESRGYLVSPPKGLVRHNETSSTVCWFACKVLYFLLELFYEKIHLDISHWTWAKLSWCSFANRIPWGWYETGNRGSNDPDVPIQVVPKLVLEKRLSHNPDGLENHVLDVWWPFNSVLNFGDIAKYHSADIFHYFFILTIPSYPSRCYCWVSPIVPQSTSSEIAASGKISPSPQRGNPNKLLC